DFVHRDGDPRDDVGHGTHVAGIIAATANNGVGITGAAWNAKLMALEVIDSDDHLDVSHAIEALNYAVALRRRGVNIRAINGSWSGPGFGQALKDAIENAGREGIMYVASAGNLVSNNDTVPRYPSSYGIPT